MADRFQLHRTERRTELLTMARAGIDAVRPDHCLAGAVDDLDPFWANARANGYLLIAVGKASVEMATTTIGLIGPPIDGLIVTHRTDASPVPRCKMIVAGHPVPDAKSMAAGAAATALAATTATDVPVVVLISGGASALIEIPRNGVELDDLVFVNRSLLRSGLPITSMNIVRQALSRFKGGGLAQLLAGRLTHTLVISDVVGDDPTIIASGPMSAPVWRAGEPWEICPESIRADASPRVRELLQTAAPFDVPAGPVTIVADAATAAHAARAAGARIGLDARVLTTTMEGDASERASWMLKQRITGVSIAAGETTVVVAGDGLGGRNQHAALTWANEIDSPASPVVGLAIGTDGRDGPTDAAGATIDGATNTRIRDRGGDPTELLRTHDSHRALALSADLIPAEPTGTNVGDLWIIDHGDPPA